MIELLQFTLFGLADNGILLIGALTGLSLDRLWGTEGRSVIIAALVGNSISDTLGGLIAVHMPLAIGSGIGCLLVLIGYLIYIRRG